MNKIKRKTAVFIAPSMSGEYILPYMIKYPDRISGLIALAPTNLATHAAAYSTIQTPVLAVWGGKDTVVPTKQGKAFAAALPNGTYKEIPDEPHLWYMKQPQLFNKMMIDFIQGLAK